MSRPVPFFLASLKLKSMDVRRTSASIGWECGVLVVISLDPASPRQKDHPVHRYWDVGERSGVALVHVVIMNSHNGTNITGRRLPAQGYSRRLEIRPFFN